MVSSLVVQLQTKMYISGKDHVKNGVFSFTVFVSVIIGLLGFFKSYTEFKNSGTTTSINSTTASLKSLHFPSLTVCNVNQVNIVGK